MLGSSSWMPYAPQGVKGLDDDDDDDDDIGYHQAYCTRTRI
jgi:hypothetical protein